MHPLGLIGHLGPRQAAAAVRRRKRHRQGLPAGSEDASDSRYESLYPSVYPSAYSSTFLPAQAENSSWRGRPPGGPWAGWLVSIALGALLIVGVAAWMATAHFQHDRSRQISQRMMPAEHLQQSGQVQAMAILASAPASMAVSASAGPQQLELPQLPQPLQLPQPPLSQMPSQVVKEAKTAASSASPAARRHTSRIALVHHPAAHQASRPPQVAPQQQWIAPLPIEPVIPAYQTAPQPPKLVRNSPPAQPAKTAPQIAAEVTPRRPPSELCANTRMLAYLFCMNRECALASNADQPQCVQLRPRSAMLNQAGGSRP
ncbi:MAG: hypothetical protein LBH31_09370 [Burkholderiaceae bacterium]|jgi:hypothetical protein|nr:hypothetical protein [Burkholderiaceae bacterium]